MKFALTLIGAAVLATGAWAGSSLLDDSEPARTVSLQGVTTGDTTTGATTTGTTTNDNGAVDISGPCDEAEHANDPRCTGGAQADDDNSGPGRGGDDDRDDDDHGRGRGGHDDNDDDDDRSGSNSGRG